jgi:hypothetical protein
MSNRKDYSYIQGRAEHYFVYTNNKNYTAI